MGSLSKLNYRIIFYLMGLLLLVNGGFMWIAALLSLSYGDGATTPISLAGATTMIVGAALMFINRHHRKEIQKREGYIIVTFGCC